MATVPPIRQTIKFEGLEEIKKKLSELGGAGEKAFEDLRAASAPAVQSMERLEGAIAHVQRSMASVAVTGRNFGTSIREAGVAFNGFEQSLSRTVRSVRNYGAVLAAAVAGVALFVRSGIQAGDDIEEQAQALGLSTQAYQELGFAASEAGVKQGQFASGIKIFSQQIQKASADAAKAMLAFVEGVDKNFDTLGGRISRVTNAAVVPFSTIREAARNLQADLASQGISRPLFAIEEGFRKLAAGGAEGRAEFERLGRVSLPAARDGLDVLRDGSEKSIKALNKLLPTFKKAEDGSIDLADAFLKTADHFKALPDGVQKTALAMAFFGRSAGPQLVPFLNQGSAVIGDFLAKTRELGLQLSGPQIKASADAARSFDLLARSATNVKNQIGAAFAPVASTIASGFTDFLSKNQIAINAFANDLNTKATPYVQAFFDMLTGQENVTEAGEKIDQIRQRFVTFGESVKRVGIIIGNAFTIILGVLDQVAAAFKAVFGTELSGAELGVILVITKMLGGFTLLLAGIKLVGAAFVVLNNGLKVLVASGGLAARALGALAPVLAFLARHPVVRAFLLAAGAIALFGDKLGITTAEAKELGEAASDATPKVDNFAAKVIDVKKQLAEKRPNSLTDNIQTIPNAAAGAETALQSLRTEAAKPLEIKHTTDPSKLRDVVENNKNALQQSNDAVVSSLFKADKAVEDSATSTINKLKALWADYFAWLEAGRGKPGTEPTLSDTGNVTPQTTGEVLPSTTATTAAQTALATATAKVVAAQELGIATGNKYAASLGKVESATLGEVQAAATDGGMHRELAKVITDSAAKYRILSGGIVEVAGALREGAPGVGAWKNVLANVGPTIAQIDAAQKQFSASTRDAGQAFREGTPGVGAFANVLRVVGPTLAEIDAAQKKASASTLPLQERIKATGQAFTEMKATSATAFSEMQAGPAKVERAMGGLSAIGQTIESSFDEAGFEITSLSSDFDQVGTKVQTVMQSVAESITSAFAPAEAAIQRLMIQLDAAIAKARDLTSAAASAGGGDGDDLGGFARGGHVRGPGTSTSDSILARLSRGEFVQREKAVRYYGTDFMAALNALRIPKDMFSGFKLGGLADGLNQSLSALMIPRFAVGGLPDMAPARASGGRSLTLVLDGQRFAGLRGPDDTIARLEKHAIAQQAGSTGRKPSWVR